MEINTLVVDASIGCAAINTNSADQTAICCIQILQTILKCHYSIAMSEEIENEWHILRDVSLAYANKWLAEMEKRERIAVLNDVVDQDLRNKVLNSTHNSSTRTAMKKDFHLLEAALATDQTILSRDKKCRKYFQQAASSVAEIRSIRWADPVLPEDDAIAWLERGAPADKKRQLGCTTNRME